jgi:FADH2-dependent halogenase
LNQPRPGSGTDADVIVVGGGPGGAAAALALAQRGRRVLVLERDTFPRFHVGESLLPRANRLFDRLGIGEAVEAAGFTPKYGATFTTGDGEVSRYADFSAAPDVAEPRTWQVTRARFDELLLQEAARAGAEVRQRCRAVDADVGARGGRIVCEVDGRREELTANAVVDASGRSGFLARRVGRRLREPRLQKVAVYGHFRGVPRAPGRRAGDIRIVSRRDLSWLWFIPLEDGVTSVGVVVDRTAAPARLGADPAAFVRELVATTPAAAAQLADAEPIAPLRVEGDFSYRAERSCGPGFALVGDAASFLDPVFSTGVLLALESGVEAADALDASLAAPDRAEAALVRYERLQRRRYRFFRRLVLGFYSPAFRDVFFAPSARFGMFQAVVAALAGHWDLGLRRRLQLRLFFLVVAAQRRAPLVDRTHG